MIDIIIVYERLDGTTTHMFETVMDMKEVEEYSKWYFENRHVKNFYINVKGE